ncbi:MAG: lysostaphin resistance A-like protein [Eubacteriales bacterium]
MNENNHNDQNNTQNEDVAKEGINSEKKEYDNPYAKFISKDEDTGSQEQRQSDNPYSRFNDKTESGETQDHGKYQSDNPYSRYYNKEKKNGEQNPNEKENPYSGYYKEQSRPSWVDDFKVNEDYTQAPLIDEAKERRNFSRIGLGYALFSLVSFAVALIIQIIVMLVNEDLLGSTLFLNILSPVSLYLFALPVLLVVLSKCEAKAPEKKKMGVGAFLLFLITALGFMYIGAMIGNGVMEFLSNLVGYDYSNGLEGIIDEENIWITAIFAVIVAPIGEEFVFRKLIIDRTQKYGAVISIGLSGLMFGLMHGNLYQFFYAFALGLLLGYIYYNTGKLYLTIAIHAIVNFIGSVLTSFLSPVINKLAELDTANPEALTSFLQENLLGLIGILVFDVIVYASMACAVIFPLVFRKKLSFSKGEVEIPRGKTASIVILNAGIIVMLILYILEFGLNLLPV